MAQGSQRTGQGVARMVRAPFFLTVLAASFIPVFFIFASVSVGAWCEDALRWLGAKKLPPWLPAALGVITYAGLGIVGPVLLGDWLLGWPGAVLGPLLALGGIAILGRW